MHSFKHTRIIIVVLLLLCSQLYSVITTFAENEYLTNKPFFIALVSNNNFPYEYINENGVLDGINIRSIELVLEFTNKPIVFITSIDEFHPDIISSYAGEFEEYKLIPQPIFISDVYFLSHSGLSVEEAERIIVINKEVLLNKLVVRYPDKTIIIADNLLNAYQLFLSDPKTVLVFGSFYVNYFRGVIRNEHDVTLETMRNTVITFNLAMRDPNLFNIVTKSIQSIMVRNSFSKIYNDFRNREMVSVYLQQYRFYVQLVLFFIILLVVFFVYLLLKFKSFSFKGENLINKYINESSSKNLEIERLSSQLEASKANHLHFLDNINTLAFLLDLKGNIVYINQYSKIILGYQPDSLIGHNIETIISPEDKQRLLNLSTKDKPKSSYSHSVTSYLDDNIHPHEIEIITKEGLKISFIYCSYFTKTAVNATQISYILQNISDRKTLENRLESYKNHLEDLIKQRIKQLKESEERLSFVMDKAYNGIFMVQNNCFTLANEALCIMTGYSKNDFLSRKILFSDLINPSDREGVINKIDEFINNNVDYFVLETVIVNYNGTLIDIEIHVTTVKSEGDNIILGVINEIAIKKELENKKLEAERLKMISSLSVTANDKINSPLNALLGYVELLEIKTVNPDALTESTYKNIYLSISIIKSILDKLRSLTSITMGKYNYDDLSMIDIMSEFNIDEEVKRDE